jgi:hypothetical protein
LQNLGDYPQGKKAKHSAEDVQMLTETLSTLQKSTTAPIRQPARTFSTSTKCPTARNRKPSFNLSGNLPGSSTVWPTESLQELPPPLTEFNDLLALFLPLMTEKERAEIERMQPGAHHMGAQILSERGAPVPGNDPEKPN